MGKTGRLETPFSDHDVSALQVGDGVEIIGTVHTALKYLCDHNKSTLVLWVYDCQRGRAYYD